MAETFSRVLEPAKNDSWGSTSTGKYPSGIFAMHLTYPDTGYYDSVTNWESGTNAGSWKQGLTVIIRTPLASASSSIAEAANGNVIAVDLKAANDVALSGDGSWDLGSENATRMIAAKINSRRIKMTGYHSQSRYLRATYVRQSLPHKYQVLSATAGAGSTDVINLELATASHTGFPTELKDDFILRVENASGSKYVTEGDYQSPALRWLRSPDGGAWNAVVEANIGVANINGGPTGGVALTGDVLNNDFTLIGESPKHTIVLAWNIENPDNALYWAEQNGGPIIQGMGAIGVHRLVAKPMDGGNRGIPAVNYHSKNGKIAEKHTEGQGFNRFSLEGLNSCVMPDLPPPDFHSIYPTIRALTTVHPDSKTDAITHNRLRIQPLEYGTEFPILGVADSQGIGVETGYNDEFTATTNQAYISTGSNGVHLKNVNMTNYVAGYSHDLSNNTTARQIMTTMTENTERVIGLKISNEEKVFDDFTVVDDLGGEFTLKGGSPFGTVIRDYKISNERESKETGEMVVGPSSPGGDLAPNMRIQLPKQEEIPGGIFVRSGHDRVQAWSNQTWGMGGLSPPYGAKAGVLESEGKASQYDTHDRSLIFHCQRIIGTGLTESYGLNLNQSPQMARNGSSRSGTTRIFSAHRASDHAERGSLLKQTNNGVETGNLIAHHRIRFGRQGHSFVMPLCHRGTPASLRRQLHRTHGSAYSLMFEGESEYKHHGFGNGSPSNTNSVFQLDTIDAKASGSLYDTGSFASDGFPLDEIKGKRFYKKGSGSPKSIADFLFAPGQTHTNVEGTPEFVSFAEAGIDGSVSTGSATKLTLDGSTFSVRNRYNTASEVMINGFFLNNYLGIGGRPEPIKIVSTDSQNNIFVRGYHEGSIRPRVATELATVPPLLVHDPEMANTDRTNDDLGLIKANETFSGGTPDAFLCHWLAEYSHPTYFGTTREHYMTFRYRESGMPRAATYPSTNGLLLRNYSDKTSPSVALPFERLYVAQWLQNYGYNALNAGGHGNIEGLRGLNAVLMGHTTIREAHGTIQLYNQNGVKRLSRGEGIGDSLNPSQIRVVKGIDTDSDSEDLNRMFYVAEPYVGIDISRRLPVRAWGIRGATNQLTLLGGDPTENLNLYAEHQPVRFDGGNHESMENSIAPLTAFDVSTKPLFASTALTSATTPVGFVANDFTVEAHPFERNIRASNVPVKGQEKQIGIGANLGITQNGMLAPDAMAAGAWDYELNDLRPKTLPVSNPVLWLKAESLDLDDGASVASWTDSSPNKWEFTQGSASAQPTFVKQNSAVNNMPVIDCDGNDFMTLPFQEKLNPVEMTMFVVGFADSDDGGIHGLVESRTGTAAIPRMGFNMYVRMDSGNEYQWWFGANTGYIIAVTPNDSAVGGKAAILTGKIYGGDGNGSTATSELYQNGYMEASAGTLTGSFYRSTAGTYMVGRVPGSYYLNGKIAEVIQYDRKLTTAEQQEVEAYLSRKYGLEISPLASSSHTGILHPVDTIPINKGSDPFIDLVQSSGSPSYAQQDSAGALLTTDTDSVFTRYGHGSNFYHLKGNALNANFHAVSKTKGYFAYPPNGINEAEITSNEISRVTPDLTPEISDTRQIQSRTEPRLGLVMEVESERKDNKSVDYSIVGTRAASLHTDKMLGYHFPVLPSHLINTYYANSGFTVNGTGTASTKPDFSKKPTWSPDSNNNKGALLSAFSSDTTRSDFKTHALDAWAVRGAADLPAWGGVYILRKTYLNRTEDGDNLRTEVDGSTGKATPSHPTRRYVDYIVRPVRPLKLFGFASDLLQDGWTLGPRCSITTAGYDSQPFHRDKRYGIFEMNDSRGVNEVEPITSATSAFTMDYPDANKYDHTWHLIPTANMLQHFKSDAHRFDDSGQFNPKIEARYSQSTHSGGGEPVYQSETNYSVQNGVMGDHSIHAKESKMTQSTQTLRIYPKATVVAFKGGNLISVDNGSILPASGYLLALDYKGLLKYTRVGNDITLDPTSGHSLYDQLNVIIAYVDLVGFELYYSEVSHTYHATDMPIRTIGDVRSVPVVTQATSPTFVDNSVVAMMIQTQSWYHYDGNTDVVSKTALNYRGLLHYEPSDFIMASQQGFTIYDGKESGVIEHLDGKSEIYVDGNKLSPSYTPPYLIDSNNIRWRIAEITQEQKNTIMNFKSLSKKSLSESGMAVGKVIAGQTGYIGIRTTDAALHLLNDAGGSKTGVSITPSEAFHNNTRDVENYLGAHPMMKQINDHSSSYISRDTRGLNTMEVMRNLSQLDGRQIMTEKNGTILFSNDVFKERGLRIGSDNGSDLIEVSKLFDSPNEIVIVGDVVAGNEIVFIRVQDTEKIRQAAASGAEGIVKTLRQQIPGIKSVAAARKLAKTLLSRAENGAPMITIKGLMNATSIVAGDIIDVNLPNQGVVGKFAVFEAKHKFQSLRSDLIIGQYEKGIEGLLSDVKTSTIDISGLSESSGDSDIKENLTMSSAFNIISVHRVRVRSVNDTGFIIGARHKKGLGRIGVRDDSKRGFPLGMSKSRNYVVK